jgi:hypothetical protein
MDPEDLYLLGAVIKDLQAQIQRPNLDLGAIEGRVHQLHRQFMRNIANEHCSLDLTKIELSTIPLRKKYESVFKPTDSKDL